MLSHLLYPGKSVCIIISALFLFLTFCFFFICSCIFLSCFCFDIYSRHWLGTQWIVNVKFSKKKKENNSVYYFRERISLYSCDVVERRPNLVISTSHGLLNLEKSHNIFFFTFTIPRKVSVYNYFCFVFVFDVLFFLYLFVYFFVLFLLIKCKC
jgi:hypothetical protein